MHLVHGEGAPLAYVKWQLCERFHWPPSVVDNLTLAELAELAQIDDGRQRAEGTFKTHKAGRG